VLNADPERANRLESLGIVGRDEGLGISRHRAPDAAGTSRALFCDVIAEHPTATVRLSGDLAASTVAELGAELVALIRTRHHQLVIDLHGLSHVSPVCVGVLNRTVTELDALGGELTLTGVSDTDAGALRLAGLNDTIRLVVATHPSPLRSGGTTDSKVSPSMHSQRPDPGLRFEGERT
jgi:anti-anti-sigma factor